MNCLQKLDASSCVMGPLGIEAYWEKSDVVTLPKLPSSTGILVQAMDEVLLPLCWDEGVLVSRYPLVSDHLVYFNDVCGTSVTNYSVLDGPDDPRDDFLRSTASYLMEEVAAAESLPQLKSIRAFGVDASAVDILNLLAPSIPVPSMTSVLQVNSKSFAANFMAKKFPHLLRGFMVDSPDALEQTALSMLDKGPIVLKEAFGVSGNGNLKVDSPKRLQRLLKHIHGQVADGKELSLIVEPFFAKRLDFSFHLDIGHASVIDTHEVTVMNNSHFSYSGSKLANAALLSVLEEQGYFDLALEVAKEAFDCGYHGPLCLDSMMLRNGAVVPLLEVNARYSMGRLFSELVRRVSPSSDARLLMLNFSSAQGLLFSSLTDQLMSHGLLYGSGQADGILPLSGNLLNQAGYVSPSGAPVPGRLVALLVAPPFRQCVLLEGLLRALEDLQVVAFKPPYWPIDPLI